MLVVRDDMGWDCYIRGEHVIAVAAPADGMAGCKVILSTGIAVTVINKTAIDVLEELHWIDKDD